MEGAEGCAKVAVVLGGQWGDEGKGKLIDLLAVKADVVARAQGGNNAGHTVVVGSQKFKFHLLPSGMLNPAAVGILGNGVVVHLPGLREEAAALEKDGLSGILDRVLISDRAHLLFDYHQIVDGLREVERGGGKIGTTRKGIGPCYSSKANRTGIRVGDLRDFRSFPALLIKSLASKHKRFEPFEYDVRGEIAKYYKYARELDPAIVETVGTVNELLLSSERSVLIEGANAALLDIDFGTYPFVTSSNCTIGGICTGLGVPPRLLRNVYGVVKAYTTRVGEGPFPTELSDENGKALQDVGHEYGSTTGRPRRCGWLDLFIIKYTHALNGYDAICLTKLDVLSHFDSMKVGVGYRHRGRALPSYPGDLTILSEVTVDYETLPGWRGVDISGARHFDDLPANAQGYVRFVEETVGVPVKFIGVGAAREAIIER